MRLRLLIAGVNFLKSGLQPDANCVWQQVSGYALPIPDKPDSPTSAKLIAWARIEKAVSRMDSENEKHA
jgi:hypothetical protein